MLLWPKASRAALLASTALAAAVVPALAQDATWLTNPVNGNYDSGFNWSTGTEPTGTAFFDASTITSLTTIGFSVGGWTLNAGASDYSITNNGFTNFNGAGIAINGGSVVLINRSFLDFNNSSTAGNATINQTSGFVRFNNNSTAGNATINQAGGFVQFSDNSTAANAT
ncbi:MAG: autotransporter, partial [Rhizobiales bacterium]|nr:autotransporter [Hyphomicrobiales bacterium]